MISLKKLFEYPSAGPKQPPMPWYKSIWLLPIPAVLLAVAAIVVLLRNAP